MVTAYILIQTEVGRTGEVAKAIVGLERVSSAVGVTGPYDVIAEAAADSVDDLGKLVVARIHAIPGITRTLTCPVVHI